MRMDFNFLRDRGRNVGFLFTLYGLQNPLIAHHPMYDSTILFYNNEEFKSDPLNLDHDLPLGG